MGPLKNKKSNIRTRRRMWNYSNLPRTIFQDLGKLEFCPHQNADNLPVAGQAGLGFWRCGVSQCLTKTPQFYPPVMTLT